MTAFKVLLIFGLYQVSLGDRLKSDIVGGHKADQSHWPWMVAIFVKEQNPQNAGDAKADFRCGGTLIHPEWVLTAAHCVQCLDEKRIRVHVGTYERDDPSNTREVKYFIRHEAYAHGIQKNDVALLRLSRAVEYVQLVSLSKASDEFSSNVECRVAGWGNTKQGAFSVLDLEKRKSESYLELVRRMSLVSMFLTPQFSLLPPRPFRVCTYDRAQRRAVTATSLDDLVHKVRAALLLTCQFLTLVLEEHGTVIDTEDFFQSLPDDAQIMVLEKGQTWSHIKDRSIKPPKGNGIAKVTFDLYKLHPNDVIGCLNIRARLYDAYTISYDLRCTRAKHLFVCTLCFLARLATGLGHLLLYGSSSVLQYFEHD